MDAVLHTQSESCKLAMRGIELFSDGSGGACNLEITSMPFSGAVRFYFDFPSLPEFIDNLEVIERTLKGEAKLAEQFEKTYVMFQGKGLGHITVSGLLAEYREHVQQLNFLFTTDQTALGPFIRNLREVGNTLAR